MTKKILHIITTSKPHGGAQRVLYNHVSLCKDYENTVIVGSSGILTEDLCQIGVQVIVSKFLRRNYSIFDLIFVVRLFFELRRKKYDLVISHSSKAGLLVRFVCWICRQPNIFVVHGWSFSNNTNALRVKFYFIIEKIASYFTDNLLFVSYYDREIAKKLGIRIGKRHKVIWNSSPQHEVPSKISYGKSTNLVFVARLSEQKDHKTLIKAVSLLEKDVQESIKIRCIGGGALLNDLKDLVCHYGLEGSFEFLGELKFVDEHYHWAKFSLLISNYEGFPIVNVESFSFGVPVIASNVGGVAEIVKDGETGFLVERGDAEGLRDLLNKIVRIEQSEYVDLAQNARLLHKNSLSEKVISEKTINYIEKCIYQN